MAEVVGSSPTSSILMTDSPMQGAAKAGLIALMAFFSITLWLGIPVGWLWIGSQVQSSTQSTGFGPYFLVIAGICVSVFLVTKLLAWLNRRYARVSGAEEIVACARPGTARCAARTTRARRARCSTW